jgi:hypothetical protein
MTVIGGKGFWQQCVRNWQKELKVDDRVLFLGIRMDVPEVKWPI